MAHCIHEKDRPSFSLISGNLGLINTGWLIAGVPSQIINYQNGTPIEKPEPLLLRGWQYSTSKVCAKYFLKHVPPNMIPPFFLFDFKWHLAMEFMAFRQSSKHQLSRRRTRPWTTTGTWACPTGTGPDWSSTARSCAAACCLEGRRLEPLWESYAKMEGGL